ncbi:MAG: 30S ribosomal protein S20 [Chlamydiae bacterium]|nr:30S ribosomal protein S20 [Chlamydiota bacterium]
MANPEEKKEEKKAEAPKKEQVTVGKETAAKTEKPGKKPKPLKRILQSEKRNCRNRSAKAHIKTAISSIKKSISSSEDKTVVEKKLNTLYGLMDKAAKKGICKPNKAARIKSKMTTLMRKK